MWQLKEYSRSPLKEPTKGLMRTSAVSFSLASLRMAPSVMAAEATAEAVRDDVRRVVLPGERERLRRRPGDLERERERERVWKPLMVCKKSKTQ